MSTEQPSPPPVEAKTAQEWQKEYEKLERDVTLGVTFESAINVLTAHIAELKAQKMNEVGQYFFLHNGLPKVISRFLKDGPHHMTPDQYNSSHMFLRSVIDVIIEFGLVKNSILLTETLFHLFDPCVSLYLRCGKPTPVISDVAYASAAETPPDGCSLVTDNINYFANRNGFKALIDHLSSPNCTLQVFNNLINVVLKPIPNNYLLPPLVQQIASQVVQIIQNRLTKLTESEIRTIKKDDFEKLVRNITEKSAHLFQKIEPLSDGWDYVENISLEIAKQCFYSQIFDKRLFGLSLFSDWVKVFPDHAKQTSPLVCRGEILVREEKFLRWAREHRLIGALFGMSKHVNLIKQSSVLLSYMASKDALDKEDLELILESIKGGHTSVATEVLLLIGNIGQSLLVPHVDALLGLLKQLDIVKNEGLAIPVVSFAASMARTPLQSFAQRSEFLHFLWENVLNPEKWHMAHLSDTSLILLSNIFQTCQDFEPFRIDWARMVLATATKGISVSQCYQLLGYIVSAYPDHAAVQAQSQAIAQAQAQSQTNNQQPPTNDEPVVVMDRQLFSKNLNQEIPILPQILSEFASYKERVQLEAKDKQIDPQLIDGSVFGGTRLTYEREVLSRFSILELFLNLLGPFEGSSWDQIFGRMWSLFILQSLTHYERESGLKLFIRLRRPYYPVVQGQSGPIAISDEATPWIFSLLLSLSPTDQKMNQTAYYCFQQYFSDTNVIQQKMEFRAGSGIPLLLVLPSALSGYDTLWNLVLNSIDDAVVNAAITFLSELHQFQNRSSHYQGTETKKDYNQLFISTCLQKLSAASDSACKNLQIMRSLSLLTRFIETTEGQVKSHFQNHQINRPITLTVVNRILTEHLHPTPVVSLEETRQDRIEKALGFSPWWVGYKNQTQFTLNVHNNFPISGVQSKILEYLQSQDLECYKSLKPSEIIIEFLNPNNGREDADSFLRDHLDKTLEFHAVTADTEIAISVLPVISHREVSNRKVALWRTVVKDAPTVLPTDGEQKASQVADVCSISREGAINALKEYNWNVETTIQIYFNDPEKIKKYEAQAQAAAGNAPVEEPPHEEPQIDSSSLSWLIASNAEHFQQIFNLFKESSQSIHPLVSHLLSRLPPAVHKHDFLFNQDEIDWESFFGSQNDTYSVLYHLQIIDSFLFPVTASNQAKGKQVSWVQKLMKDDALFSLLKCVSAQLQSFQPQQQNQGEEFSKAQMECLARLMRITSFVLEARTTSPKSIDIISGLYGTPFLSSVQMEKLSLEPSLVSQLFGSLLVSLRCLSIDAFSYGTNTPFLCAFLSYSFRLSSSLLVISHDPQHLLQSFQQTADAWKEDDPIQRTLLNPWVLRVCDSLAVGLDHLLNTFHSHPKLESDSLPFFLSYLFEMQPKDLKTESTVSTQFYKLLSNQISRQIARSDKEQQQAFTAHAKSLIDELTSGNHIEQTGRIDKVLAGKLQMLVVLLEQEHIFRSLPQEVLDGTLAKILHDQFLFTIILDSNGTLSGPFCTSKLTRLLVFRLLLVLCRYSRENYSKVMHLMSDHFNLSKPTFTSWYHQRGRQKNETGYVGLKNLSATCYMNSLLQQFYNIKSIRDGILAVDPSLSLQKTPAPENMLVQLQHVFGFLSESLMHHYDPISFFNTYKDMDGRPVPKGQQQDVDEYFNRACSELERLLTGTRYASLFRLEFGGVLSNEIKSTDPQYPWFSENPENFLCIPLDVKGKSSLDQALNALVTQDKLEGDNAYLCEKYGRKVDATKRYSIKSLSNLLTFSLKRFDYDVNLQRRIKINDYFSFPKQIDMRPWSQEGLHGNEPELQGEPFPHREDWYYQYVLVGVLVHIGSCDSGHYYSFRKVNENDWHEFNDSDVKPFNINNLDAECFGGKQWVDWDKTAAPYEKVIEKSAYMLFYERVKKEVIVDYSASLAQGIKEKNAEAEPENKIVDLVDPPRIKEIPVAIHQSIWEANRVFLRDQYMLDPSYADFAREMVYLIDLKDSEDEVSTHLDFVSQFVYEILVYTSPQSVFEWSLLLRRAFMTLHLPAFKFLIYSTKPIGESKDETDNFLKKFLLDCPHERVRISFVDVLVSALDNISNTECKQDVWPTEAANPIEYPVGKSIACMVFAAIQRLIEISRKSWMSFRQYWEVNWFGVQMGIDQRRYFKDLINVFSDYRQYYMNNSSGPRRGYSSISIMDDSFHSDLRVFIDTLRILVCGSENEHAEELEWLGQQDKIQEDVQPPNKEHRTCESIPGPILPPLSKSQKEDIFDYSFFNSLMEMEYNLPATIKIINHVSWDCPQRTKWIFLIILDEFDRVMPHKQIIFCEILASMLGLEDSFQQQRVAWCLTPFPLGPAKHQTNAYSNGKTTGLLGHLKNSPKFLIHFLMHLQSTNKHVREYLRDRRSELLWMRDSLVSVMETESIPVPMISESHDDVIVSIPSKFKTVEVTTLFTSLCGLIKLGGTGTSDNGEVLELLRKMETLEIELRSQKKENEKVKTTLESLLNFYKPKCQDPPPEHLDLSMIPEARLKWGPQKPDAVGNDSNENGEAVIGPQNKPPELLLLTNGPSTGPPALPSVPSPSAPVSSPEPKDLASKISSLGDIFPGLSHDILKVALKHNNWIPDQAAMALFENETRYYQEAMQ